MISFEMNLKELDVVYRRCLTNFIDSLPLYPKNAKLADLKQRYNQFFKMFADSTSINKSMSNTNTQNGCKTRVAQDDDQSVSSYSIGLTQMFAKHL
ncbi:hypothetical protein DCAR_0622812 [Daucus carota subsp. sativus]|uniref:Uncharacterized protein n=1 Tax=Daucus carota subsp. sativus TaxID=79200 RepID=A0A164UTT3_DAUCS|nr:hypothetical protein DCAR_0622812 [Daucus carota subsp. sativus]